MSDIHYADSQKINLQARPLWGNVFSDLFGVYFERYINWEDNAEYQKKEVGDAVIYFKPDTTFKPLTVELKTAGSKNYSYFKEHNTIFVEDMGNVERQKLGSSIWNCKADLWAYGFLIDGQIRENIILWLDEFKDWLSVNMTQYENSRPSTDQKYHTSGYKIPMSDLERFRCRMPYR